MKSLRASLFVKRGRSRKVAVRFREEGTKDSKFVHQLPKEGKTFCFANKYDRKKASKVRVYALRVSDASLLS